MLHSTVKRVALQATFMGAAACNIFAAPFIGGFSVAWIAFVLA